jgi:hypothetical protein
MTVPAKKTHWAIPVANELGYFPTERQATEINCRAATLYAEHFGGKPPRGRVVDDVANRTMRIAIEEVMSAKVAKRKGRAAVDPRWKEIVVAATVRTESGGQGVLVPGPFILTAAHCITYTISGGMVLGDHIIEKVTSRDGTVLKVGPLAVEPVSDIAVLGSLDNQTFYKEAQAFEAFCAATPPVPVAMDVFEVAVPTPAFVLSHKGHWINAAATAYRPELASLCMEADEQIEGGTSGGPVVTAAGRLLGVVSHSSETGGACDGLIPRASMALPAWVIKGILAAQS